MMKPQDQEEVTAAVTAALAALYPFVKRGAFEGKMKFLEMVAKSFLTTVPDDLQYLMIKAAIAGHVVINTALREVIIEKLLAKETLQPNLEEYLINHIVLTDRNKQKVNNGGRPPVDFFARNVMISIAVQNTIRRGFHPTRNDIPHGESACSIVALALGKLGVTLTEKHVAKIWQKLHKRSGTLSVPPSLSH